jgi:hypothetical protein
MATPSRLAGLATASLILLCSSTLIAQTQGKIHPVPPVHIAIPPSNFEQFEVYWTEEAGWHTDLQLRNNLSKQELTLTPSLRSADGTEVALEAVSIAPGDVATVNLHDAILKSAPQFSTTYGSVALRYRATVAGALHAVAMIHLDGHPIAFHLDAYQQPKSWTAGSREGIWWLPRDTASDFLILTNTGDQPLDTTLILRDAAGNSSRQKLALASRQTTRLSVRSLLQKAGLTGTYGGVTIDVPKSAWALDTAHVVYDELGGSSQVMKMFDHDPKALREERTQGGLKDWTIRAPMLALSHPDSALGFPEGTSLHPQFLLRNTTPKAYTASVHFAWRSAASSGKTAPFAVALKPNETRLVDVAALQAQSVISMEAEWASVFVTASGVQPDELMAVAMSYDETGRYGAQTPFNDQLAAHWEGDQWQVDSTHNSLITAGNGGTKPVTAKLTLYFNHGQGKYELERTLAPEEQLWLDVGNLIHDQTPDKNGKTLAPDATSGAYKLEEEGNVGVGSLFEGKLILDKTYGEAAYGCMVCCGDSSGTMDFDPMAVPLPGDNFQSITGINQCTGDNEDITGAYTTWWTGSTSIATANMSAIHGV